MLFEDTKILKVYSIHKIYKMSYVVYADVESLIKRKVECKNNPEKLSTTKNGEHIPSGHSMFTIWVFVGIENKHNVYNGEDCVKLFCESLRENSAMKIINFEKKKMIPLTNGNQESHEKTKNCCYICK